MHGDIDYKFCWLHPQSKNTSWTWISWDTNWEPRINKEENQRRNLTSSNFAWLCEMPTRSTSCRTKSKVVKNQFRTLAKFRKPCETKENEFRKPYETKAEENQLRTLCKIFASITKSSYVIFRYFCTDSIRFLSQDILCNYLFSPCNQLKIFLDI